MKQFLLGLVALLATASAFAATTYTYTGPAYTTATGTFTTSMNVTGSFTTATPLAPNFSGDITGQISSYSFSDGLHTYTSSDANGRIYQFLISTDPSGSINAWQITVEAWLSPTSPHSVGDLFNFVQTLSSVGDFGYDTIPCTDVGVSPAGVADTCIGASLGTEAGTASGANGSWTRQTSATSIPTLSEWGMITLASLLALGTVLTLRRQRK